VGKQLSRSTATHRAGSRAICVAGYQAAMLKAIGHPALGGFIGGCDRSGTTLLGDLLGSSRWAITAPESQFMHELLIHLKLGSFKTSQDAAHWLQDNFRFAAWGLELATDELEQLLTLAHPRRALEAIVERYAKQYHPHKSNADMWVDHTPDNFNYQPMLKTLFPEARFIHIVRDGRAICASIKDLDWGPNNAYTASRHWANRLQQALTIESAEGDNCYRVHYEDLVTNPRAVMIELCNFIDIPFDESILAGGGLTLPEFTRSQHRLVGQAPQPNKAEQWKEKLSRQALREFDSYPFSRVLLENMGYPLTFAELPKLTTLHTLSCYCHEFICYLFHRLRHRRMERRVVKAYRNHNNTHLNTSPSHAVNS